MPYKVILRKRAAQDLERIFDFIAQDKPNAASNWINYIQSSAQSLENNPSRVAIYDGKHRHLTLKNGYGIFFWIDESKSSVYITRIFGKGQRRQ